MRDLRLYKVKEGFDTKADGIYFTLDEDNQEVYILIVKDGKKIKFEAKDVGFDEVKKMLSN